MNKGLFESLEQLQYEARPIIYAALAMYSFMHKGTMPILLYCGWTLTICCLYVMKARYQGSRVVNIR